MKDTQSETLFKIQTKEKKMNEREILDKLIKVGKITEEDVIEADCRVVNAKKANIVDTLHIMYCTLNHDNGECNWYKEEQTDYPWGEPFHQEWLKLFNDFLLSTKLVKLVPEGDKENGE